MNDLPNDRGWEPQRSFDEIRNMAYQLQRSRSPVVRKMLEVQQAYEGDTIVPLPNLPDEPDMPNLTPSLITDVVDGLAMRAASVRPMVFTPAKRENVQSSRAKASDRRRILSATYELSGWALGRRRYLRHVNAYEVGTVFVRPDFHHGGPRMVVRSPLETYPEEKALESLEAPDYVSFITRHSGDYLRSRFPQVRAERGGPITDVDTTEMWDVFEWVDTDQLSFGLLGPVRYDGYHISENFDAYNGPWMPLTDPMRNRAERCLAVTPGAVTLHRIGNRLNALLESTKWQNRLMALEILAQEKAIFPDMYVMGSRTGMAPRLIDGDWHDGREGKVNVVEGADSIGMLNTSPDPRTSQMIDRLERNVRQSSGLSPMMSGESHGAALRTGRALAQMAEVSIDPRIQELHEIDEVWMPHVNAAILDSYTGWWNSKRYELFSGWRGDIGELDFTPSETIETTANAVSYAIPGADIMQITTVLGSLHGAEVMSTSSMQKAHPWIDDPDNEQQRINDEKMERGAMEGMLQQLVSGQMPMSVFARIRKKMEKGKDLIDATVQVDNEIRAEQMEAQQQSQDAQLQAAAMSNPLAQMGMAAGPAAAAPGLPPGGMPGAPQPGAGPPIQPGGPAADMRAMLQGGAGGPGREVI